MKLTKYIKNNIVIKLSDKVFEKKMNDLSNIIISKFTEEWLKLLPTEVVTIFNNPNTTNYINKAYRFSYLGCSFAVEVPAKTQYSIIIIPKNYSTIVEKIDSLVKEYNELIKESNIFKEKLTCSLETINTSEKLRREFPEAYDVLPDLTDDCTTIESLRATLSKIK